MGLLILLGLWLVAGPVGGSGVKPRENAIVTEIRVGNTRGVVEVTGTAADQKFRVLTRDGYESPEMTRPQFEATFGPGVAHEAADGRANWVFRVLNITSWVGLAWVVLGFVGQALFFARLLVQWIASEREQRSVVPVMFWWFSLLGGVMLFAYFVWRRDIVGVLGQTTGVVVYMRNLRLIYAAKLAPTR